MSKIVIIGEKEDILPYQSIGVEIEPVKTTADTVSALRENSPKSSGVNYINYREHGRAVPRYNYGIEEQNSQGDYHCLHGARKQTHEYDRT